MDNQAKSATPLRQRNQNPAPTQTEQSITLSDVYYILFRHKWKIIVCGILGLCATIGLYFFHPPHYQSVAKLFIRYVNEGKTLGGPGDDSKNVSTDPRGTTILNTEVEILTSLDLAEEVADVVGPERILAKLGGGNSRNKAAAIVQKDLTVEIPVGTSVIRIAFKHPDPTIVQPVLNALIQTYLKKHVEIHAAVGIVGDFLTQETTQLRTRLSQTEEELQKAKDNAGVISLDEAQKAYPEQINLIRDQIFKAEAELAERKSMLQSIGKPISGGEVPTPVNEETHPAPSPDEIDQYSNLLYRVEFLQKKEQELLAQYTPESEYVRENRMQLGLAKAAKRKLEVDHPQFLRQIISTPSSGPGKSDSLDPALENARLIALQAKIRVLNAQLDQVKAEAERTDHLGAAISDLRRRKDLEEANYRYYEASLEQARINEALGSGKVSNISEIQAPTPPFIDWTKASKLLAGLAASGWIFGLAWAVIIELYLDRTVRRPIDIERILGVPLFLSIPKMRKGDISAGLLKSGSRETKELTSGEPALVPQTSDALRPFHETLRDRLISYFESNNLTHKPKLVAVSGFTNSSGVTTTAAGLAATLSETGEGNVLLVDLTVGQGSAQQFYKGGEVCGLDELLETRDSAQIHDNLYVVAPEKGNERLTKLLPQRFSKLVPKLKASNFDYIIFDMPPVSQISVTPRLAGFMDMVLLVVESETTDRELVRRAASLLSESKAHVGVVMNKTTNYVPAKLSQEYLGNL